MAISNRLFSRLKFRILLPAVLACMLVGIVLLGSPARVIGGVAIPPPPYIPKSPAEDIVMVEAYIEQGTPNVLHLTVTFAAATPPPGEAIFILVTRLQGNPATEVVLGSLLYGGAPKITHSFEVSLIEGGNVAIAVYAMLGTPATDRAPDTGFYQITSLSAGAPNRFSDYENVGGIVLPINGLAVLAPYLAVIGLVATAAVAFKRKRVC
jgi:hypothetical protein